MDGGPLTLARDFKALKVDILSTGKDHVSPDLVADCQRRGIQVWVWTVNSLHFMERLLVSCGGRPAQLRVCACLPRRMTSTHTRVYNSFHDLPFLCCRLMRPLQSDEQ